MSRTRAHLYITGRVQGVGFRANTRRQAHSQNVNGWVRNLDDGRVEAVFEGDEDSVESLIDWCHSGPRRANVENVSVEYETPENIEGFRIKR
ncbi:MAG: acylphosphatase [Halobacteriaceae archaeon]